jgi:hypothetical protein
MDAKPAWLPGLAKQTAHSEEAWLLGQPPLQRYLDYMQDTAIGGAQMSRSALVDEWRTANDYWYELEQSEAGIADRVEIRDIDPGLKPCIDEVKASSRYSRGFNELPTRFAMVELEKLIVSQRHVDIHHTERLKARLAGDTSLEQLFWFCMPVRSDETPIDMRRLGAKRFLVWSKSSDFRFHEAALLRPGQISDYEPFGPVGAAIGVMLGYGSNLLNAVQSDNRLLLHNGHHRAYTLLEMGFTHAPCIVRTVTRRDELNLLASADAASDPTFYFRAARPPLLRDFFNPRIRKVVKVPQLMRLLEINIDVKEHETRDFGSVDESWLSQP